jgi:hypothetical protein
MKVAKNQTLFIINHCINVRREIVKILKGIISEDQCPELCWIAAIVLLDPGDSWHTGEQYLYRKRN